MTEPCFSNVHLASTSEKKVHGCRPAGRPLLSYGCWDGEGVEGVPNLFSQLVILRYQADHQSFVSIKSP